MHRRWNGCGGAPRSGLAVDGTVSALQTARLVIEPLVATHARQLFADLQHPELYGFIPGEPPESEAVLEARFTRWEARTSPDGREAWLNWVMRPRDSEAYVGTIQATIRRDGDALLAYQVFPRFWRQGFAHEGCARVITWLFVECAVGRVVADIDTRNVASIALVESLGFRRVGMKRDADWFKGGPSDEYRYELIKGDWQFGAAGE
ncbi:MAG: GNAT family N-acetyltransferase [Deltaproteobacteria bacterium]|nr:GNAT family N-acetyltransferase [Deltaproteobacteria bacterium]